MNGVDKILLAIPAGIWLTGWLALEAMTLAKVLFSKNEKTPPPIILDGIHFRLAHNDAAMAQLCAPLFGKAQVVASTGLMKLAPGTQEGVFAHEVAHLKCNHARLVRWLLFTGMLTATLAAGAIWSLADQPWRCLITLCWFGQLYFLVPLHFLIERQADARAAAWLSGDAPAITPEATEQLAEAVRAIVAANHGHAAGIKRAKTRITRIRTLTNQPCGNTAPDRAIRRIWAASFVLLALDLAAIAWLVLR